MPDAAISWECCSLANAKRYPSGIFHLKDLLCLVRAAPEAMVVIKATVVQRDIARTTMRARAGTVARRGSTRRRVGRSATTITTKRKRAATVEAKAAAVAQANTVASRGASTSRVGGAMVVVTRAMVAVVEALRGTVLASTGPRAGGSTSREGGTLVVAWGPADLRRAAEALMVANRILNCASKVA